MKDTETITAAYLIGHVDQAFIAWRETPESQRVGFDAFLNFVLPYRGSQEPIHDWIGPLRADLSSLRADLDEQDPVRDLYRRVSKVAHERVRFDERFYLHPTGKGDVDAEIRHPLDVLAS